MVKQYSPEEAEAWWAEYQQLKKKADKIEERIVALAKDVYSSFLLTMARTTRQKYIQDRASYYLHEIVKCKNEKEMSSLLQKFADEYAAYQESH